MNRLIDDALEKLREIEAGHPIPTMMPALFTASQTGRIGARLIELDLSIHHSTVNPQKLLKNDGTIVTQIVESVRLPDPDTCRVKAQHSTAVREFLTVSSFLSANAIRATDSMDGNQID